MPREQFLRIRGLRIRDHGRLPHWEADDASYFVTFRLHDSLPPQVIARLKNERTHLRATATTAAGRIAVNRAFGKLLDSFLDRGHGTGILREHGEVVANALRHFDGERYELQAWCVMPNHVHVLLFIAGHAHLDRVVHSWKSYTAHMIGRGVIWAREYYDHVVRGPAEFDRIRE